MRLMRKICGYKVERMPDISFRLMSFIFLIRDFFFSVNKRLDTFGIHKGSIVVDFGCGPGSYIESASQLVGDAGRVYAVDVHPLAIKAVEKKMERKGLRNVVPVLATEYPLAIERRSADVIYALDMFHHVRDSGKFLGELHRLLKPDGTLFIESGHQPLKEARERIVRSGCWTIVNVKRNLFTCKPKQHGIE